MTRNFLIRPIAEEDKKWIVPLLEEHWGSVVFVTHGRLFNATENKGFAAFRDEKPVGLITYHIADNECEITTLNSLVEKEGIGVALVEAVRDIAEKADCRRVWLITTNDNVNALRFYQKIGMTIAAVYPNSIKQLRLLKPEITETGNDGIPIRDEIELELAL